MDESIIFMKMTSENLMRDKLYEKNRTFYKYQVHENLRVFLWVRHNDIKSADLESGTMSGEELNILHVNKIIYRLNRDIMKKQFNFAIN